MPRILSRSDLSRTMSFSRRNSTPNLSTLNASFQDSLRIQDDYKSDKIKKIKNERRRISNCLSGLSRMRLDSNEKSLRIISNVEENMSYSNGSNLSNPLTDFSSSSTVGDHSFSSGLSSSLPEDSRPTRVYSISASCNNPIKSFLSPQEKRAPDEWGQFVDVSEVDVHQRYGRFVVSPHSPHHSKALRNRNMMR